MRTRTRFLQPLRYAPALLLPLMLLASCAEDVEGPKPKVEDAVPGAPLPVAPGIVCNQQHAANGTPIVVTGDALSPLPFGIPDDPTTALPTLTLVRARDLAGNPGDELEVVYGGEPGQPNAELLSWQSQTQMTFVVQNELALPDGTGALPVGVFDLRVTNPNDNEGLSVASFAVVDRPRVDAVAPGITCVAQGARTITLTGQTVLSIEGQDAFVRIAGEDFPITAMEGCTPIAHGALEARFCTTAVVELPADTVAVGFPDVTLQNPQTAACASLHAEDQVNLRVVPPPTLDAAVPSLVCSADGTRDVVLQGSDFLVIDGDLPSVTLVDASGATITLEASVPTSTLAGSPNCETLETQGHDVQRCVEVAVVIPVENPTEPYAPQVTLTNPEPAGCSGSATTALVIVPDPTIDVVIPPVACVAQGDRTLTLEGTGFIGVDDGLGGGELLPTVTLDGTSYTVTALDGCTDLVVERLTVRRCTRADLLVPASAITVADGTWLQPVIELTNPDPAGCAVTDDTALTLVPPPTVASAEPPLLCNAQADRQLTVTGTGFLVVDGELPAISVGGDAAVVDAASDCAVVPVEGPAVEQCTTLSVTLPMGAGSTADATVTVTNPAPAGCDGSNPDALTIVPPPTVDRVVPPAVCLAGGDRPVDLEGTGFLDVGGAFPTVNINGTDYPVDAVANCTPLTVDGLTVQDCTTMTVTLPQDALVEGAATIVVTNPPPALCDTTNATSLVVIGPPVVAGITPPVLCDNGSLATVTVSGERFVTVDGAVPEVVLDGVAIAATDVTASGCTPVTVENLTVEVCTTLEVVIDPAAISPPDTTVSVNNPAPVGCSADAPTTLAVTAPPAIIAVTPALLCTDNAAQTLVVTGERFYRVANVLPTVTVDGVTATVDAAANCTPITLGAVTADVCTELTLTVPQGANLAGDVDLVVTNPAPIACDASRSDLLDAVPPVTVSAVVPPSLCNSPSADQTLTLEGTGFASVDGTLPSLTLGGVPYPIDALGDCTPITVAGLTAEHCTELVVTVTQAAALLLAEGDLEIGLTNPAPVDCGGTFTGVLTVSPPPSVTALDAPGFCADAGGILRLTGSGFTVGTVVTLESVDDTYTATTSLIDSSTLDATFPSGLVPGDYDLRVTNGDCTSVLVGAVSIDPTPLVFFVDPPVVFNGITTDVTVYTTGLLSNAASVELIAEDGTVRQLTGFASAGRLNRIQAPVPAIDPLDTTATNPIPRGTYQVRVVSQVGCESLTNGTLVVTDVETLTLTAVDPAFVSPTDPTSVTVSAAAGSQLAAGARAYMSTSGGSGTRAEGLRAVVVTSPEQLTGIVPAGLGPDPAGTDPFTQYDLIVVNQPPYPSVCAVDADCGDGASCVGTSCAANACTADADCGAAFCVRGTCAAFQVGRLAAAIAVTLNEPPVITSVTPSSLNNNADVVATLQGANFATDGAGVLVDMTCKSSTGATVADVATNVSVDGTGSLITATLPSGGVPQGYVCVITVTNVTEGSSFTYSAVSTKTPSQNLGAWTTTTDLLEGRRGLALLAGRPTNSSRVLYALGGDAGDRASAKDTVESIGVDVFGGFSPDGWSYQVNGLPAGRTEAGFARIGRFLYLVGGFDGTSATDAVLRAQILDPLAGPELYDLDAALGDGAIGLDQGFYFYRVAALFPDTDPSNPNGESLPGDVLPVQLPQVPEKIVLTLKWNDAPGATAYRIYRAALDAQGAIGPYQQLTDVQCATGCSWVDDGSATLDPTITPLPPGSLGEWHALADGLLTARDGLATVAVQQPGDPSTWYLYAFGGRDGAGALLDTYEYAMVAVAPDGSQVVSAWTTGSKTLGAAKANLAAWAVTSDATTFVGVNEVYIFVGTGFVAGGETGEIVSGSLSTTTTSGDLVSVDGTRLDLENGPTSRAATCYGAASGFLFTFGGEAGGLTNTDRSGAITAGPDTSNSWSAPGGGSMSVRRSYCATAQESAFFFTAGGTDQTNALTSVQQTVQ